MKISFRRNAFLYEIYMSCIVYAIWNCFFTGDISSCFSLITPTPRCFFVLFSSVVHTTSSVKRVSPRITILMDLSRTQAVCNVYVREDDFIVFRKWLQRTILTGLVDDGKTFRSAHLLRFVWRAEIDHCACDYTATRRQLAIRAAVVRASSPIANHGKYVNATRTALG